MGNRRGQSFQLPHDLKEPNPQPMQSLNVVMVEKPIPSGNLKDKQMTTTKFQKLTDLQQSDHPVMPMLQLLRLVLLLPLLPGTILTGRWLVSQADLPQSKQPVMNPVIHVQDDLVTSTPSSGDGAVPDKGQIEQMPMQSSMLIMS